MFLLALVSDHIALEKEYVAHFLSIAGLRHPLLHAVGDIPAAKTPSGDYEFSLEQYLEVRVALLRGGLRFMTLKTEVIQISFSQAYSGRWIKQFRMSLEATKRLPLTLQITSS